jgi:hypothetical protein
MFNTFTTLSANMFKNLGFDTLLMSFQVALGLCLLPMTCEENGVKMVSVASGKPLQSSLVTYLLTTGKPHFWLKKPS